MGMCIIKLTDTVTNKDYYLHWSTTVDAPITYGLSKEEFKQYYKKEFGIRGMIELKDNLDRVDIKGTSSIYSYDTVDSIISGNRAGKNEKELTKEQILEKYCRQRIGSK